MKKNSIILGLLLLGGNAHAANFAVITQPPTLLSLIVLIAGVGCLFGSVKILSLVRGGLLFKSWQIFLTAFIVLSISQLANLVNNFEIFILPSFVVPALLVLTFGLFLLGVFETKKTLE